MGKSLKHWFVAGATALAVGAGLAGHASASTPAAPNANHAIWMMGEVHDNPEAHFFRLQDLSRALGGTWRPALLMEQFDTDRQDALTQAWQTCKDADCVIRDAGGGANWNWDLYKPLINLALEYRLPLVAANLSREQVREVMKTGYGSVFDEQTIQKFGLNRPLPAQLLSGQAQAIDEGHCNMLDAQTTQAMVRGQIARDVNFARLIEQYAPQGVVLVAGNGHVRRDIGVLQWLSPEIASRVVVSGYVEPGALDATLFDRIRFVQPHDRPDPCEAFRKSRGQ
ncbi:ChaN family lipoprotein [Orrella marina]|uniref:Haem-binding uptake Tiki superfamily ChaN domain-containing protein n=1 Tax=Orrella marina TaxID=2163011 RepID=A0A2R4XNV4_9BURK|nr:ChaN family lipoprotein [Orrella marina]AWB35490.1 hypothetical protein DBV39_19025 [Orrella marina]